MGAVVSDYTGEVLVSDDSKVKKLNEISMRFNEDFRNLHAFVILSKGGSVGLARMALTSIIDKAVEELG